MKNQPPLTIVVFGPTGDLFKKKIARAIFDLWGQGFLGEEFRLVGYGRRQYSPDEFRQYVKETLGSLESAQAVSSFLEHVHYVQGFLDDEANYQALASSLANFDKEIGACSNKLFYLAVPPTLYEIIFKNLAASGLANPCIGTSKENWTRILVEKPFGNNAKQAAALDQLLGKLFAEDQIFRIDHYLAKETLQNILHFRFSNSIFEPIWNNQGIDRVVIRFLEHHRVADRGAFYDTIGALGDVGQNHMLQMLALIAMERPKNFDPAAISAESYRLARQKVLESLKVYSDSPESWSRAQYNGYRFDKGVASNSETETYFKVAVEVKNRRFRGIPFYLEGGKAFDQSRVDIQVFFKSQSAHQNSLVFSFAPEEKISVVFWSKKPGFGFELECQELSFSQSSYDNALNRRIPDAYERVLFDAIKGDATLFTTTREVKAEWKIVESIMPILKKKPLKRYEKDISVENPHMIES